MTTTTSRHGTRTFDALVELTLSMRSDWHSPGIRDAIRTVLGRDDPPRMSELAAALVRLAENPTVRTPAVLALDGPHWRHTTSAALPRMATDCPTCHQAHLADAPCPGRPAGPDHAATTLAEMRATLADLRAGHCAHHVPRDRCADCRHRAEEATTA